jgi:hypothetical protein
VFVRAMLVACLVIVLSANCSEAETPYIPQSLIGECWLDEGHLVFEMEFLGPLPTWPQFVLVVRGKPPEMGPYVYRTDLFPDHTHVLMDSDSMEVLYAAVKPSLKIKQGSLATKVCGL